MTGYAVYGAMEESGIPSTYATNMIGLQTELTNNKDQLAQTKTDLDTARAAKDAALQQTQSLASANDGLTSKLSESETLATALEQERDEARSALQESARQLCCVQRVLNPQIDSYGLEKGVIVCGESKTVSIKC